MNIRKFISLVGLAFAESRCSENAAISTDVMPQDSTGDRADTTIDPHDGGIPETDVSFLFDVPRNTDDREPIYSSSEVEAVRVLIPSMIYAPTLVTSSDGSLWGWGANQGGYFQPFEGNAPTFPVTPVNVRLRPQRVEGVLQVREVAGDDPGLCVLAGVPPEGRVYCWGITAYSGTGVAHGEGWNQWRYPRPMGTISDVLSLSYPGECTRADHGDWLIGLYDSEWHFFDLSTYVNPPRRFVGSTTGLNQYEGGVAATGFAGNYATREFQPQDGIVMIAGDFGYACVLLDTGRVRCLGHNQAGQTGNGFDGSEQTCGTRPLVDGGTTPTPAEPCVSRLTEVPGLTNVVKISLSTDSSCALKRDGTVWCWGWDPPMSNGFSSLGYGGLPNEFCVPPEHAENAVPCRKHPTQVVGVTDAIDMALGPGHSCAVRRSGSVVCWGNNNRGQLGDWTLTDRATPVTVRWH